MNSAALICLKAIIECQCQCMGMTAENLQREVTGKSPAFDHESFRQEIDVMNEVFRANISYAN